MDIMVLTILHLTSDAILSAEHLEIKIEDILFSVDDHIQLLLSLIFFFDFFIMSKLTTIIYLYTLKDID